MFKVLHLKQSSLIAGSRIKSRRELQTIELATKKVRLETRSACGRHLIVITADFLVSVKD